MEAPPMHNNLSTPQSGPAMEQAETSSLAPAHPGNCAHPQGVRPVLDLGRRKPRPDQLGPRRPGHQSGPGFADTVTVLVLGNLIGMLLFGSFVLLGQKTGATGTVLARAAFGRRATPAGRDPGAAGRRLVRGQHLDHPGPGHGAVRHPRLGGSCGHNYAWKIGIATFIMAAQVAIAWFGYKAIAAFEKWTVPPTIIILVVMSAVAWFGLKINWGTPARRPTSWRAPNGSPP